MMEYYLSTKIGRGKKYAPGAMLAMYLLAMNFSFTYHLKTKSTHALSSGSVASKRT